MIKTFRHKGLEDFFFDGTRKGVQAKHASRLRLILDLLDAARLPQDMNFPGSGLHVLRGDLNGYFAVKISGNWRLIFRMNEGDAYDVNYLDYH